MKKSLTYAPPEEGRMHVLLCRAVCGDMFYTEQDWPKDCHVHAKREGKDSVMANPKRTGAREFVVQQECQVYPEFILVIEQGKAGEAAAPRSAQVAPGPTNAPVEPLVLSEPSASEPPSTTIREAAAGQMQRGDHTGMQVFTPRSFQAQMAPVCLPGAIATAGEQVSSVLTPSSKESV